MPTLIDVSFKILANQLVFFIIYNVLSYSSPRKRDEGKRRSFFFLHQKQQRTGPQEAQIGVPLVYASESNNSKKFKLFKKSKIV